MGYERLRAQAERAGGWELDRLREKARYDKAFGAERCPEYVRRSQERRLEKYRRQQK